MGTTYFAAVNAIVAKLKTTGVTVWDGPVLSADYSDAVFVGFDADPNGSFESATLHQDWEGLGARRRQEQYDIHCAALATLGEGDSWSAARARAATLIAAVETALRADPSVGQPPPFVASFKPGAIFQEPDASSGFQVRISFTVSVELARA